MTTIETREFQAEARQLLDLMIHSVYSEKDIFLRELISNASDALDKLRLEALLDQSNSIDLNDLHIRLSPDQENRTLSITDNGVGMSKEDCISLLGTIAKSGTREYLKQMKEQPGGSQADLIGQFGVGFYSSFMVADKVVVETRRVGHEKATRWTSTGDGSYTIEECEREANGTTITLHLKPADEENRLHDYTDFWTLKDIVKRYSDFINYPVKTQQTKTEGDPPKVTVEDVTLNSMKALWLKSKDEVTTEEYHQFYQHISRDWGDPFETIGLKAEGTFEYHALLFIPKRAPMDLYMAEAQRGLQLYVRRVFIMDHCEELLPPYMRFMRGVVDAQDLPLNLSREILQKDRHIAQIRKRLVKKVLDTLKDVSTSSPERYLEFWKEFGRVLKEGLYHEDDKHRETLLDLALFRTTKDEELVSLATYLERKAEGQEAIYYLNGENLDTLKSSPHLESFKKKGVEVLLLTDPVDLIWLTHVQEFRGVKLQSAALGDVKLGSEEEQKAEEEAHEKQTKDYATFLSWLSSKIDPVKEVRISRRLTESPSCLVGEEHDMSANLERLMKSMGQAVPKTKRILEINPEHAWVTKLHDRYEADKDSEELARQARLLYGVAVLAEGGELESQADFCRDLSQALA